jgi:tetratricopeptide (TPR) repeat protein
MDFMRLFRLMQIAFALAFIVFGVGMLAGCRAFRVREPDSHSVKARQLSLRGADLLRRSRYEDAETLFTEAIQNCPTDERAHWGYAATLWENGQHPLAIRHMQEAVRLSGSNPEFLVRLGEMYLAEGDSERAKAQATQTLKNHRDRADAWALLGDSQAQQGNHADALESYQRALLIKSDYPRVQIAIADAYRKVGRPLRSLATLDRMVDIHPTIHEGGETQLVRGLALMDLDRREEAVAALKAASDGIPVEKGERLIELVSAQYQLGELVDARLSLGKLLQHAPEHPEARVLQSQINTSFEVIASKPSEPARLIR